jgi:CRISPR-associated protein Cmr3
LVSVKDRRDTYRFVSPQTTQSPLGDRSNLKDGTLYPSRQNGNHSEILESLDGAYLDGRYLQFYLTGQAPQSTWVKEAEHLHRVEPRIGLGRNAERKTAMTGLLYAARHVRMEDDRHWEGGFVVEVEGDGGLLPASGMLRLGGDSRPAEYREASHEDWSQIRASVQQCILQTGRFKMVLVTPAIFKAGWYPDCLQPTLTGTLPDCTQPICLAGACVGKPLSIGGFDLIKGHPKPIQKAVPAGSVYFFKFSDWDSWDDRTKQKAIDELLAHRFNRSLCQDPHRKEGFGVALIGGW